jgi:hypothetical protein
MKILQVLLACVRGAAGHLISDDMVCVLFFVCLFVTICFSTPLFVTIESSHICLGV